MVYTFQNSQSTAFLKLFVAELSLKRDSYTQKDEQPLTIIYNCSSDRKAIRVDDKEMFIDPNGVLSLMASQHFLVKNAKGLVAWQFNREFYCIVEHDHEVSCSGLLFYGTQGVPLVALDQKAARSFDLLVEVFQDEFRESDNLRGEMLRLLLKRLIVKLTRLYKQQFVDERVGKQELDVIRQFGLLVELHYREKHKVQEYADMMNKSPKTLANLFGLHAKQTPLQLIQNRILLEAKRRLIYTEDTAAEVAYACGFTEPAHFSRFFKRLTDQSPSAFRKSQRALSSNKES